MCVCGGGGEGVPFYKHIPLVEIIYDVLTCKPRDSYCWRFTSLVYLVICITSVRCYNILWFSCHFVRHFPITLLSMEILSQKTEIRLLTAVRL